MLTAQEALERLKQGNQRFVSGDTKHPKQLSHQQRAEMAEDQNPFAIRFRPLCNTSTLKLMSKPSRLSVSLR